MIHAPTRVHRRSRRGVWAGATSVAAAAVAVALLASHSFVGTAAAEQAGGLDPAAPGPHKVAAAEYTLGDTAFRVDDFTVELTGAVHYPTDVANGRRPLVILLHGLFATCADKVAGAAWAAAREALHGRNPTTDPAERERQGKILLDAEEKLHVWPCPAGIAPVPSHRGYDYLARQLASHGFVAVSLSANGINAGSPSGADDYPPRAALINKHLSMWQELATSGAGPLAGKFVDAANRAPVQVDFRGHVDLSNVGTMGHSRGGRGVMNHAADKNRSQWPAGVQVKAVVPLEPVASGGDAVTKVPFATVIGACDRTSNPSARQYFDDAKAGTSVRIHQLLVHGANHQFFNSEWSPSSGQVTSGDDAYYRATKPYPRPGDCRTTDETKKDEKQLSEEQQRSIGTGYLSAFFRRYLAGDTRLDPMLTGKEHPMSRVGTVDVAVAEPVKSPAGG